jgi:hypothetical protein
MNTRSSDPRVATPERPWLLARPRCTLGRMRRTRKPSVKTVVLQGYETVLAEVARVIQDARRIAARSVNSLMTKTYWQVGQRIVEQEQRGALRAEYGEQLLSDCRLISPSASGRGFSERNLEQMRSSTRPAPESIARSIVSPLSLCAKPHARSERSSNQTSSAT